MSTSIPNTTAKPRVLAPSAAPKPGVRNSASSTIGSREPALAVQERGARREAGEGRPTPPHVTPPVATALTP